jgi:adenine-specific DNA-methyltransferase
MNINYKNVNKVSEDIKKDRVEELKKILPEVFTEGKIDIEKLKLSLGEDIDERPERFNFTWAGKNNAIKTVLVPSRATLKPSKDESVKFDESENLIIEGDNLEVLKLLQKTYFGKVKMIYIDPPYNTGGDFVYHDDFSAPINSYLKQTGQLDDEGNKQSSNKETNGRYHSDWLSMMYPRLKLAWNLLNDDGIIFVSIDDNEVHNLRKLMDEVFGEENFLFDLIRKTKTSNNHDNNGLNIQHEYTLVFSKNRSNAEIKGDKKSFANYHNPDNDPKGDWGTDNPSANLDNRKTKNVFEIKNPYTGKIDTPPTGRHWLFSIDKFNEYVKSGKIFFKKEHGKNERGFILKRYKADIQDDFYKVDSLYFANNTYINQTATREISSIFSFKAFEYTKPTVFIKKLVSFLCKDGDIILDFFAGSGTTAQAVLELNKEDGGNRKFVLVQLPEKTSSDSEAYKAGYKTIAEITKDRIRKTCGDVGFKVFKLSQSNYPEISFEFDPDRNEDENQTLLTAYLSKAKQTSLLDSSVNPIDVVYENVVKEGFSLNSKVVEGSVDGNHLFIVTDGESEMRICLDLKISPESVKKLSSIEFKGKTFVCYDNALTDSDKANISLNLELKTI